MNKTRIAYSLTASILAALVAAACSSSIEASHPTGADVAVLTAGAEHSRVLANLGPPAHSYKAGERTVDVYSLDPEGPSQTTKSVVESLDVVADVCTVGIAEIVLTPLEYATKHEPTNYVVTYGPDDKVATVEVGGEPAPAQEASR